MLNLDTPHADRIPAPRDEAADPPRPTRQQAEDAVRTLLRWGGESPRREGLLDTPARVVRAWEHWLGGYAIDPAHVLGTSFDGAGYDEAVVLRDIPLHSMCEHHLAAIRGVAHVAYLPDRRVVGISKLARLVDAYSRRLQLQERLTCEIADTLWDVLRPRGVAVVVRAQHDCLASRGIAKPGVAMVTRRVLGEFAQQPQRADILALLAD
jgi:GTP cyclohydrolase I